LEEAGILAVHVDRNLRLGLSNGQFHALVGMIHDGTWAREGLSMAGRAEVLAAIAVRRAKAA
jgi:hypothetical protein